MANNGSKSSSNLQQFPIHIKCCLFISPNTCTGSTERQVPHLIIWMELPNNFFFLDFEFY